MDLWYEHLNKKNLGWLFVAYIGDEILAQLYREYFIREYVRIPSLANQDSMERQRLINLISWIYMAPLTMTDVSG